MPIQHGGEPLHFIVIEPREFWVPDVLWRLDADYKALPKETPWLSGSPL